MFIYSFCIIASAASLRLHRVILLIISLRALTAYRRPYSPDSASGRHHFTSTDPSVSRDMRLASFILIRSPNDHLEMLENHLCAAQNNGDASSVAPSGPAPPGYFIFTRPSAHSQSSHRARNCHEKGKIALGYTTGNSERTGMGTTT